jgi:hypothetical protein
MPGRKTRLRVPDRQRVPRIRPAEARKILQRCEGLLAPSGDLLSNLRQLSFASLLSRLDEDILQLSLQPGSWGERTRARLISAILPSLGESERDQQILSVDEIAHTSNILMPCFLLELGRRKQHIQIEFPADPTHPNSRFRLSVGSSHPTHSLNNEQLLHLVSLLGEELVGLCYFGDQESRARVEAELSLSVEMPPSASPQMKQ